MTNIFMKESKQFYFDGENTCHYETTVQRDGYNEGDFKYHKFYIKPAKCKRGYIGAWNISHGDNWMEQISTGRDDVAVPESTHEEAVLFCKQLLLLKA